MKKFILSIHLEVADKETAQAIAERLTGLAFWKSISDRYGACNVGPMHLTYTGEQLPKEKGHKE